MFGIIDIYKPLNISIGTVMENPEMLKFAPDHLKTKTYVSMHALPYLLRYLLDRCKNQKLCDKAILQKWWNNKVCS